MTDIKNISLNNYGDEFVMKRLIKHSKNPFNLWLEWLGVISAIIYSVLIALNIGAEQLGFLLLLCSALLICYWAFLNQHRGILVLQVFYGSAALIGIIRWD